jgi:hypothetical protein
VSLLLIGLKAANDPVKRFVFMVAEVHSNASG